LSQPILIQTIGKAQQEEAPQVALADIFDIVLIAVATNAYVLVQHIVGF